MKQANTIEQLKTLFPSEQCINAALLYGSFGRNEATPNSDIDIQLLVDNDFQPKLFIRTLKNHFLKEIEFVREVKMRQKIVVYYKMQPKIEFSICTNINELEKYYLGSEISDVNRTILFEKQPSNTSIAAHLQQLIRDYNSSKTSLLFQKQVDDLIEKFLYEFESCSSMHRRSDGYQFYFFYNIALQVAVQLNHLSKGQIKFNFLPKYFIANVLKRDEQENFYKLHGTLFLPEANQHKRRLLDFFYSAIKAITPEEKLNEVKSFCEWIFNRDFFWNFRDISTHNTKIKGGSIFRSATMTLFQNENRFHDLLYENNINTVIDLRSDDEVLESSYTKTTLTKFNYVRASLDPVNQPDWFIQNYHQGTNEEIAYRYFVLCCNDQIKTALEAIINEKSGAVTIHCFAGKDRTGIFVSLLHLLSGASIDTVYMDYMASEVDVQINRLKIALDIIQEQGGIDNYILRCGLSKNQISQLKQKLSGI